MPFFRVREISKIGLFNLSPSERHPMPSVSASWTSKLSFSSVSGAPTRPTLPSYLQGNRFPEFWLPSLPVPIQDWEGRSRQSWAGQGWAGEASWALFVLGVFFINWSSTQKVWWLQAQSGLQAFVS